MGLALLAYSIGSAAGWEPHGGAASRADTWQPQVGPTWLSLQEQAVVRPDMWVLTNKQAMLGTHRRELWWAHASG